VALPHEMARVRECVNTGIACPNVSLSGIAYMSIRGVIDDGGSSTKPKLWNFPQVVEKLSGLPGSVVKLGVCKSVEAGEDVSSHPITPDLSQSPPSTPDVNLVKSNAEDKQPSCLSWLPQWFSPSAEGEDQIKGTCARNKTQEKNVPQIREPSDPLRSVFSYEFVPPENHSTVVERRTSGASQHLIIPHELGECEGSRTRMTAQMCWSLYLFCDLLLSSLILAAHSVGT
jgi:hypothetical protein